MDILLGPDGSILLGPDGYILLGAGEQPDTNLFDMGWTTTPQSLSTVIKSYLYVQYNDDDDLQAFVAAFNQLAQTYVSWFINIGLPIYTGTQIAGLLLDWVGEGLYGTPRPSLPVGQLRTIGPYGTYHFNELRFNQRKIVGAEVPLATSDDLYKRILTWNFYKGDGTTFSIRWLKRRIMRFLLGDAGTAPNIDQTHQVSVTFGTENRININLRSTSRRVTGGAFYGRRRFGELRFNQLVTAAGTVTPLPNIHAFAAALRAGALQLPFQYTWIVNLL